MKTLRQIGPLHQRRSASVSFQLLVILGVAVIVILAVGVVFSLAGFRFARHDGVRSAAFEAGLARDAIDRGLDEARATVAATVAQHGIWQVVVAPASCSLLGGATGPFATGHVDFITPEGAVLCSSFAYPKGTAPASYAAAPWLRALVAATTPVVTAPFPDPAIGRPAVAVVAPFRDPAGRVRGAFIDVLGVDDLAAGLNKTYAGPSGFQFTVTDAATGVVIASSSAPARAGGRPPRDTFAAASGAWKDLDGSGRLFGSAVAKRVGWRVYAGVDDAVAFAAARGHLRSQAVTGIVALILIAVTGIVVERRIADPLRRLSTNVSDDGHEAQAAPVQVEGSAEVVVLAERFNELRERGRADELQNAYLAAASHELRTPLASVIGLGETVRQLDGDLSPEVRRELVGRIVGAGRKMDRIIVDLFDLLRVGNGTTEIEREPVDIVELARRTVRETEGIERRVVHVEGTTAVQDVDARMVTRMLENLLSNAAKHTGPAATIWLRIDECPRGVSIVVEDDGPGVAPDDRERIFERFERDGSAPGLGVGLSLVSKFAQLHGGRAWVQDRAGGGASFHIELPTAAAKV